jgi:hybrid cluster-associated redox disulfide protein
MLVNQDMTIMEILNVCPETANVFMRYGMHCIFCEAASGETLGEAQMVHGIGGQDAENMLNEINECIAKKTATAEA